MYFNAFQETEHRVGMPRPVLFFCLNVRRRPLRVVDSVPDFLRCQRHVEMGDAEWF